jgi:hypothetical protein
VGPFDKDHDILCSIYLGAQLKAKNIKIKVEDYDPKTQQASCRILNMNEKAQKVMQNYAE